MPTPVLTNNAVIMCAHGGQVKPIPKQVQVMAGGAPVLRPVDLLAAPIIGCAQPPTPATVPCTLVAAVVPGPPSTSATVKAGGLPVLLQTLVGLTNGVPPSPLIVSFPGQVKVLA